MSTMINMRIKNRIDSEQNWTTANPVLMSGEIVFVNLEGEVKAKVGDGSTNFNDLPYLYDKAISDYVKNELSSYPKKNDISVSYDSTNKKIVLNAGGNTSEIDASSFIKDGMLSNVNYDKSSNKLVLSFNTDSGSSPISVNLSSLVDVYTAGTGLSVTNNQFKIDDKVVATKTNLSSLSSVLNENIKNKVTFRYWSEA